MLIDKAEIERVKRANELVGFIRSRGVSLTQRGKQLVAQVCCTVTLILRSERNGIITRNSFPLHQS